MSKIRITFNIAVEYEPNPYHYNGCETLEQMLAIDLASAKDDPFAVMGSDQSIWNITGEVIP